MSWPIEHLGDSGRLERAFIDGAWILPEQFGRTTVIDPSTEELVAEFALGAAADVAQLMPVLGRKFRVRVAVRGIMPMIPAYLRSTIARQGHLCVTIDQANSKR